jgi:hypothetical protein
MPLQPAEHGELNKTHIPRQRFADLRRKYQDDPVALQQIDVYDPETEYHDRIREYIAACRDRDPIRERQLRAWFKQHYPDITRTGGRRPPPKGDK